MVVGRDCDVGDVAAVVDDDVVVVVAVVAAESLTMNKYERPADADYAA